jgi:hypothetical protein
MQRDAILVLDGQEILNYGRQSMPTFTPGHRLNSGPFGTMGVGLPFGLGAKIAKPDDVLRRALGRKQRIPVGHVEFVGYDPSPFEGGFRQKLLIILDYCGTRCGGSAGHANSFIDAAWSIWT